MYRKGPCYGCTERELGCHDRCDRYQAFKTKRTEVLATIREEKERERDYVHVVSKPRRK